jgi:hypothetical protein
LKSNGALAFQHWANCIDDAEAKYIALTRNPGARQVEVWSGETLILTRPLEAAPAAKH